MIEIEDNGKIVLYDDAVFTDFFTHFNQAKKEGATDIVAYHRAIINGDGVCYHPQRFLLSEGTCPICGAPLKPTRFKKNGYTPEWYWARPRRIFNWFDMKEI